MLLPLKSRYWWFHDPKNSLKLFLCSHLLSPSFPVHSLVITNLFSIDKLFLFWESHHLISGNIRMQPFETNFFHSGQCLWYSSKLFLAPFYCWAVVLCLYQNLLKYPPFGGYLSCFQFLLIIRKVAINICVWVFVWP